MSLKEIEIIAFDADDTLWENENFFRDAEKQFCHILKEFGPDGKVMARLFQVEVQNMEIYGYGIKAFILSLIETALLVSGNKIDQQKIGEIIKLGKEQIARENELFPEVENVLKILSQKYRLIVATKGDLLDQERKLKKSGLLQYFHHIEIMSDKKVENYRQMLNRLEILPQEFVMVGNSLKSDILPIIELGANAIHIPFHTTWIYEEVSETIHIEKKFQVLEKLTNILNIL